MIELHEFKDEDTVRVKATSHCAGQTRKGPGRLPVVLAEGDSGEVAGYVARRWAARKRCEVTGEAFSAGGGKFARIVYAASPAAPIDASMDSVEKGMSEVMAATNLDVLDSTHAAMVNLGFPEDIPR